MTESVFKRSVSWAPVVKLAPPGLSVMVLVCSEAELLKRQINSLPFFSFRRLNAYTGSP